MTQPGDHEVRWGWICIGVAVLVALASLVFSEGLLFAPALVIAGALLIVWGRRMRRRHAAPPQDVRDGVHLDYGRQALVQAMVYVAKGDGKVSPAEAQRIDEVSQRLFGHSIGPTAIAQMARDENRLEQSIGDALPMAAEQLRGFVLPACAAVAMADGRCSSGAFVRLRVVASMLGLPSEAVDAEFAAMTEAQAPVAG